ASYLVRAGGLTLLIDCGPAVLQQLDAAGVSPEEITHLFVTHRHGDHVLGYPVLLLWWLIHHKGPETLPTVISSDLTWSSLEVIPKPTYGGALAGLEPRRIALSAVEPGSLELGEGVRLRTWPMTHSDFAPVLGLRLEVGDVVLAFTGDTAPCDNIF